MKDLLTTLVQPKYRVPLATILGFSAAGAYYYYFARNKSILYNFVIPGATMAIGFNVVGMLMTDAGMFPIVEAKENNGNDMGKLSKAAVEFLQNINPDELYSEFKKYGVKIAPVPDNPSIVNQDLD